MSQLGTRRFHTGCYGCTEKVFQNKKHALWRGLPGSSEIGPHMLVIFDLNGVLLYRHPKGPLNFNRKADAYIGGRATFVRPYASALIYHLINSGHEVGIWTTAMQHNAHALIALLGIPLQNLKFVWTSTQCHKTNRNDEKGKNLLTKPLSDVWNKFKEYNCTNTVIVDDSILKTTMNPKQSVCTTKSYTNPDENDQNLSPYDGEVYKTILSACNKL